MPGRISSYAAGLGLALSTLVCIACNETPPDRREWRASDHDHTANPNAGQVQVPDGGASESGHALNDVTIVTWQQNCITCHGSLGRGDGPQGQLLHAADLSRPDWQAAVTDETIATTIRQGRGRMPGFKLPESTIKRLVALVRMLELNRMQHAMAAVAASAAPAGAAPESSAAPATSAASGAAPPRAAGR